MKSGRFQSIMLGVPVLGPLPAECACIILHELLKHQLYMRCQIPAVYDDLEDRFQVRIPYI